eukprot:jgi/Psemu1/25367/gm1.25367_g
MNTNRRPPLTGLKSTSRRNPNHLSVNTGRRRPASTSDNTNTNTNTNTNPNSTSNNTGRSGAQSFLWS